MTIGIVAVSIYVAIGILFGTAEAFYRRSLECRRRHNDQIGLAVTYGNLGRLYLRALRRHVDAHGELPTLVLLGNHGIVVNAPSAVVYPVFSA